MNEKLELWDLELTKRARKDFKWHQEDGTHWSTILELMKTIEKNPYERTQGYKALKGKLKGLHERRISKQYRMIYSIEKTVRLVCILSAKDHT